jgi:hypothetical protein
MTTATARPCGAGVTSPRPAPRALLLRVALAAAGLLAAVPALACSVCGCGDPLQVSSDPAAITGSFRLQLDFELLRVDAGADGGVGTDQLVQRSWRLNAVYRPLEALTLAATVPVVSKRITRVGAGPAAVTSDLTGLGDAELSARYALWRSVQVGAQRVQELAVAVGTAIPTGAHDAKDPAGDLIDPHGQLGTGGWGPFAGLHYRYEQGDWTAAASLSWRIRTQATFFDATRYKFGDALLWGVHGQYLVAKRVALDLGLDGREARPDRAVAADGTVTSPVENTGGTVWSLAPGVYVDATAGFWLFARGQVPVVQHLDGIQEVKPSFTVGVQYLVR